MTVASDKKKWGFTLTEIIIVLAIIGLLGAIITPLAIQTLNNKRAVVTIGKLKEFKKAVIGDPRIIANEVRTNFGYIGDMGSLPSTLDNLYIKGTQPDFTLDSAKKTGAGWSGPYIDPSLLENLASLKKDGYGNDFTYSTTEFTDPTVGATVSANIVSNGQNRSPGGGDDISINIYKGEAFSTVIGYVTDEGGFRIPSVPVKINYPSAGSLTQALTITDSSGLYTFNNIPYGNRSISVEPGISYSPGSALTSGANNQNVEFKVTNFSASNISITSFTAVYTVTPTAYYEQLKIGGIVVYDSDSPRKGSGDTTTFAPITIAGSGADVSGQTFTIRVQSPLTRVADLNVGKAAAKGGTIKIEMNRFKDAVTGAAATVSMKGVTFECTFSDGSKAIFAASGG